MKEIKASKGVHLRLKSGEHLESLAAELLRQNLAKPVSVPDSVLVELEVTMQERVRDLVLWLRGRDGCYACPVEYIDSSATREFLERAGKAALHSNGGRPFMIYRSGAASLVRPKGVLR